jgi:peptidoglycan-N-acetylmuramic acid deacetylase
MDRMRTTFTAWIAAGALCAVLLYGCSAAPDEPPVETTAAGQAGKEAERPAQGAAGQDEASPPGKKPADAASPESPEEDGKSAADNPPAASQPAPEAPVKEAVYATGSSAGKGTDSAGKASSGNKPPAKSAAAEDRKPLSWYYMKKGKGKVPDFPADTKKYTDEMKALWVGTGKKVYLTIDTGGDLGDIDTLVKSLKDNDVKANFFIAGYNVRKNPDFIRTLVADGHLVANHTMTHTDMNKQTDEEVKKEIEDYEKLYKEVTGEEIQPFFRFPYGKYSMHLLKLVSDMGYTSVFWSTAMRDWEPRKNGAEDPYNDIMNNLHDGNIILMHQGSPENIQALDRIVKEVKKAGYEFALLTDIQPPE